MIRTDKITLFSMLAVIWFCLSGKPDPVFLIFGAISCFIALYFSSRMDIISDPPPYLYLTTLKPLFVLWLFKEIIIASITVSVLIWKSELKISPILSWIKSRQQTDVGLTVYANSITLTPGTVCVDVQNDRMLIHSLVKNNIKELDKGFMDNRIKNVVEGL